MKRDWDCIRAILLALEDKGDTVGDIRAAQVEGYDAETVSYNMRLLIQADLIEGNCSQLTRGPLQCFASAMTWEGHELLDKIRSDTLWNKVKSTARERAIPLSFDVVKLLAIEAIKHLVGG
jgi:hypothetical protein